MSGGSHRYLYRQVEEFIDIEEDADNAPLSTLRKRFVDHLRLVAKAMHDIEWVDSADYGHGEEEAAIRAALGEE